MSKLVYKGYTYSPMWEQDDDKSSVFHILVTESGTQIEVPFYPFREMKKDDLENYIDLGMPEPKDIGCNSWITSNALLSAALHAKSIGVLGRPLEDVLFALKMTGYDDGSPARAVEGREDAMRPQFSSLIGRGPRARRRPRRLAV